MRIINFRIIIKNISIYIGLIIAFAALHEIAHGLTAIILGGEWQGMWLTSYLGWGRKSSNIQDYNFYTYTTYNGILSYRSVKIAGSLVAAISALWLNQIAKKRQNITIYSASWTIITEELLYWTISPILKFGDGYQFLQSFKEINQISITTFSLIFFMLLIFSMIVFYRRLVKIVCQIELNRRCVCQIELNRRCVCQIELNRRLAISWIQKILNKVI